MLFTAKPIENIDNGKGFWQYQKIGIFQDDKQIGEYIRNYPSFMSTFHPFMFRDKWYALYSKDYTATRIMSLPDCQDLGGEERDTFGFCPVDYYVPFDNDELLEAVEFAKRESQPIKYEPGSFGFVAGCIWGDDSSWKVQYLDLSECDKGIIKRTEKFGYLELAEDLELKDAVSFSRYFDDEPFISIAQMKRLRLDRDEEE